MFMLPVRPYSSSFLLLFFAGFVVQCLCGSCSKLADDRLQLQSNDSPAIAKRLSGSLVVYGRRGGDREGKDCLHGDVRDINSTQDKISLRSRGSPEPSSEETLSKETLPENWQVKGLQV